jgi:hypothetical protein
MKSGISSLYKLPCVHKSFRPPLTPPCQGGGLALPALNTMKSGISSLYKGGLRGVVTVRVSDTYVYTVALLRRGLG